MLKLYSYYRSTASYRVRLALQVKGLAHDYEAVHLVRNGGEQYTPEYKTINPQSMVPVLVDGDTTLTQSLAIIEYLNDTHPEPPLLPEKPLPRAYVRQIAQIAACDIHPLGGLRVLNHLSGEFGVTQAKKLEWVQKWVTQGFDAIETLLDRSAFRTGPYVCGDHVTLADICLIPEVYHARRYEIDMSAWPLISQIEENCLKLKTFADASPENQPDTPEDQRPAFLKGRT